MKRYLYSDKYKVASPDDIYGKGLAPFGPKRGLLSSAQEDFLMGLVVETTLHRKPLSVHEIGRWVTLTGIANGTVAEDSISHLAAPHVHEVLRVAHQGQVRGRAGSEGSPAALQGTGRRAAFR